MSSLKETCVGLMPKDWNKFNLEDISEFITKGATPTTYGYKWEEEGIPFLRSECVSENGFSKNGIAFISEEANEAMQRSKIKSGDILISITGNVGRIVLYPEYMDEGNINQHIARVRVTKTEIVNRDFIFYQLSQKNYKNYYYGIITGAAYPQLSLKQIRETPIFAPKLSVQQKIASILSSYDDLLKNNLERIKLLEEAAQHLYKEWFVNFRFPGSETTPINKDSGLPEGWEKINLFDFAEVQTGYSFKAKDFNNENRGKPAIRIRDIPNQQTRTFTTEEVDEKYAVEQGDILIGMDGFFYIDVWGGQKGLLVQRVSRLRAYEPELQGFLLEALREPISYFEKTISGATVAHLGIKHLKEISIKVPMAGSFKSQLQIFNRFNQQKINLLNSNRSLKEVRNLLLPRLMNKTLEV